MSSVAGRCPSCGRTFPRGGGHCPFDGTKITALAPAPDLQLVGRVLEDRYEVREPIATGRIATTYRGYQISVARDVAIQVIHPELARDHVASDRFLRAAQLASQLVAPAIGNVFDVGHAGDDLLYVVSELVRGRPLAEHARSRLSLRRAVGIAIQVCDALDAAHRANIVHGDLTPATIHVDDATGRDAVKVVDFGLVRALEPVPAGGPPLYTAPEALDGTLAPAGDLYALGCILFELLVGAPPFAAASAEAIAAKHRGEPPPPLPPNVPAPLAAIVHRLLAKPPRDRLRSARELRTLLDPVLAAIGGPATDLPRGRPTTPPAGSPYTRDPTTPPTGPSGAYAPRDPTVPPTGPSGAYAPRDPTVPPTGPSGAYAPRDPTVPPTGPSGAYAPRDPTVPPTGPSGAYAPRDPTMPPAGYYPPAGFPDPHAPVSLPAPPPQAGGGRRVLVIVIVALVTAAAGIAAVLAAG